MIKLRIEFKNNSKTNEMHLNYAFLLQERELLNDFSEALGMKLGSCEQGLIVTHIEENSVADVIGLKPGDIIFKVISDEKICHSCLSFVVHLLDI